MKKIFYLCFLFMLQSNLMHAQILQRIKDQVKWKAEQKAMEKINQGIDNVVDSAGKKIKSKKKGRKKSETELTESEQPTDNAEGKTAAGKKEESKNQQGEGEGFLELRLSADKIFVGGVVKISGKSILYKEYNSIELSISGKNYTEQKNIKLDKDGGYNTIWNVPGKEGDYIVTAVSSDKKVTRKEKITVYELPDLEGMADENIEQTNKAYEKVKEKAQILKGMISAAQSAELDKKISDFTEKKRQQ